MKKLIAVLLSAAMLLQTAVLVFATDSAATFNVGKYAATFAYGSEAGTKTSYAVDGKTTTSWISANTNANYKDYLVLDLGAAYSIENFKFMPAEGTAANFTVYGATSANGAKTAITDKITTLTEGAFTTVDTIDDGSYRFIYIEQDAAETAFGFAEIEVNTLDDVNPEEFIAGGPSQPLAVNTGTMWYVNYAGYANGNGGRGNLPNMTDADPATAYNLGCYNPQPPHAMIMIDMGEAKKVSHLVYQGTAEDNINGSGGYDQINNFKIVASNDSDAYLADGEWEVVATVSQPATYLAGDGKYDTGLMVFDVASIIGTTPYRYYGLVKTDKLGSVWRMSASTLQVYETVDVPLDPINVAKNKAVMAYGSTGGTNPAYAVDGDAKTYWESINNTSVLHDNLVIDLGVNYAVDSIRVTLAHENAAKAFSVYGSKDIKENGKTKLCDVANADANDGQIYSAGTEAYRYIVFEKAPSDKPLAFAEIEVNAPARSAGETCQVSLISEGKKVTGSTYQDMSNWDVSADNGAKMVDNSPETRFGSSANLTQNRFVSYFVDLGDSFPISHVVYQGTDRGDYNPVNNENDNLTGYTIIGTNTAPSTFGVFDIKNFDVLATKTGYPYVGEKIESNFFGASTIYDTGLTVMPVNGTYRYIGIVKDHAEDGGVVARLGVNTLQVYAKVDSVIDYVKNQGTEQLISAETASVTEDSVSYQIDMLNAGESYAVTGLFANAQDATKTAYADGRIPMAGTYGSLNLTATVADGKTGTWDLIMLRDRKAVNYIQNIASPQKVALTESAPSGNVAFTQSGLTGTATGKANAKLLGMMILKPGKDKDNFSAADICYHMVKPMPKEDEEFSEDFTFKYTFKEDTEAGDYTAVFFSENGIFSDKAFTFTMHPVTEIKTDFASVTTDNFMTNVQAYPAFFGSELVSELNEANQAEGSTLAESFMMAKSGLVGGVFNGEPASWDNANTIAAAVKASLIIEETLQGKNIEDSIAKYGDAMPAVFENADFDKEDFCDILPSVIQKATIANENDLLKEYNRTIALALIANGSLEQKEKAITNYATELLNKPETLACGYTLRALADELSTSISDCKTIYADGMDAEIQDVITKLNEKKSEGGGSVTLGGNKNNISTAVPGGSMSLPSVNVPVVQPEKATAFVDLAGFGWAESSINFLVDRKIIAGVGNDCFDPAGLLNREQATKLLILSLNLPTEEHKNGFKDCEYGAWYYPYITSAQTRGLIKGVSKNTFGIGTSVTRQDLAVMIYRAISKELPKLGETQTFADDALIAEYAKEAVSALASLGIITGHDDGSFAPTKTATRAEASAIFARLIEFMETNEEEVAE